MIIVGELINASRQKVGEAIEKQDEDYIARLAREQRQAGADYIDVNAGVFVRKEPEYLKWLVEIVQKTVDAPCCIDSPSPAAIEAALSVHQGTPMINSISLEKERYEKLMPVMAGADLKVVALCMSDAGMPQTADQRQAVADKLINGLVQNNVKLENIYVDPLVQPVATDAVFGMEFLNSLDRIVTGRPGVHTMCGLSNISYGLPERKLLNQTFMAMAIAKGLDGAILNPMDRHMMAAIFAAEALSGRDDFCTSYLGAFREGRLKL